MHFLSECHWYELTSADCPDRVELGVNWSTSGPSGITSKTVPIPAYVTAGPASDADISSEDWDALRDSRKDATLCPDCQDRVDSRYARTNVARGKIIGDG